MLQLEVLVLELGPVDALPSGPVEFGEITPLDHEVRDYPVEDAPVKRQLLPRLSHAVFTSAQGSEVLGRFRNCFPE